MEIEHTETIQAPLKFVWQTIVDSEAMLAGPNVVGVELLEGSPGKVGAVSRIKYKQFGGHRTAVQTVISRRDKKRLAFEYVTQQPVAVHYVEHHFQPDGKQQTAWRLHSRTESHNQLIWFLNPLLKWWLSRRLVADMQYAKRNIESLLI